MRDRRAFLKLVSGVTSLLGAALAAVPALVAFLSPAFRRKRADDWVSLGSADRFDLDVPVRVDFAQTVTDAWVQNRAVRNVWVYTEDGEAFTVYNPRCTHLGCSYAFVKESALFLCPCHLGQFDTRTGAVVGGPPARGLDRLPVKVEDGILYAAYREF
ncbi:MAG TPA: ubiquinol-cytochrome c reductase iron-sulfur subunit [Gemmatimonadales bacterium]